jgi:methyl-accepting chemotaxis protein
MTDKVRAVRLFENRSIRVKVTLALSTEQAARGTDEVSSNIAGVNQAASETGAAAAQVLSSPSELSKQSETMRTEVEQFLANIRAA